MIQLALNMQMVSHIFRYKRYIQTLKAVYSYFCCNICRLLTILSSATLADNTQLSFDAREACGHTLKSSLIHKLSYDTRDDRVLPTNGVQATLVQELAGLSPIGTTAFFKTMCSFDISKR